MLGFIRDKGLHYLMNGKFKQAILRWLKSLVMSDYQNKQEALMMYSDEELLGLMKAGNREAFTMLYHRFWENLFITAAKALRGKEEAADVVQDVFLSFWNRHKELDIQGSLAAYLQTSVRYKCIHYIEKNITRRDYLARFEDALTNTTFAEAETVLQLKEIQKKINTAVDSMPAKMQEVYKLSRHEHLSHKEIAAYMTISVETVKKHIQHALHLIRRSLPPDSLSLISFVIFSLS